MFVMHGRMRPRRMPAGMTDFLPDYRDVLRPLADIGVVVRFEPDSLHGMLFRIPVSRAPSVGVLRDGSWVREDGERGPDAMSLAGLLTRDRAAAVRRTAGRGSDADVLRDCLQAAGYGDARGIRMVRRTRGGGRDVTYMDGHGHAHEAHLTCRDPRRRALEWADRLDGSE